MLGLRPNKLAKIRTNRRPTFYFDSLSKSLFSSQEVVDFEHSEWGRNLFNLGINNPSYRKFEVALHWVLKFLVKEIFNSHVITKIRKETRTNVFGIIENGQIDTSCFPSQEEAEDDEQTFVAVNGCEKVKLVFTLAFVDVRDGEHVT